MLVYYKVKGWNETKHFKVILHCALQIKRLSESQTGEITRYMYKCQKGITLIGKLTNYLMIAPYFQMSYLQIIFCFKKLHFTLQILTEKNKTKKQYRIMIVFANFMKIEQ